MSKFNFNSYRSRQPKLCTMLKSAFSNFLQIYCCIKTFFAREKLGQHYLHVNVPVVLIHTFLLNLQVFTEFPIKIIILGSSSVSCFEMSRFNLRNFQALATSEEASFIRVLKWATYEHGFP
jgi:hypothetical protein